jgi:superfamily I DNA and RNA helicase
VEGSSGQATREAIDAVRAEGFRPSDIVVLSFQGRDKSRLASLDKLGEHSLSRFTGAYDDDGMPVHREGNVRFESVFRFKGQCAPCIILTEIDFDALDEAALRRIFVGATRATMKLVLVMSERAAQLLTERL